MVGAVFGADHAYLHSVIGAPLTEAMAQLAVVQPEDPIEFLGTYLLNYVANEEDKIKKSERGEVEVPRHVLESLTVQSLQETPTVPQVQFPAIQNLQSAVKEVAGLYELYETFLDVVAAALNCEEAYIGTTCMNADEVRCIHWIASSRGNTSVTINKFVAEEQGVTFDALQEVEDPEAVDADGNPLPASPPVYIHIENVLREPRMKFYHVPKLGAYVCKAVKFKKYLHADIINDGNPEEPNVKDEWLVLAADTMGQARSFTKDELQILEQAAPLLQSSVEELERTLYMKEYENKKGKEDTMLHEFSVSFAAQLSTQEEKMGVDLQSVSDEEKALKEGQARSVYMTQLLLDNVSTLSSISTNLLPLKQNALNTLANAFELLGQPRKEMLHAVSKQPSWDRIAPLLDESTLKAALEKFQSDLEIPAIPEHVRTDAEETTKADIEASSIVAATFFVWVQSIVSRSTLEAAAEEERKRMEEEAAEAEES